MYDEVYYEQHFKRGYDYCWGLRIFSSHAAYVDRTYTKLARARRGAKRRRQAEEKEKGEKEEPGVLRFR